MHQALLSRVGHYLHAVPLSGATGEQVGPFTLFRTTTAWPYYARPTPGTTRTIDAADISRLRDHCEELGLPLSLRWVVDTCPSLAAAAADAGLEVTEYPLLVLQPGDFIRATGEHRAGILPATESVLREARAVASVAFGESGTAVGEAGHEARNARYEETPAALVDALVTRAEAGVTVFAGVSSKEGLLASGQHQPLGTATEIVAVATLPAMRRQGLAAAVTSSLVEHAFAHGIDLVLLSAESDAVAAVYARVGFRRIGSVGAAE